MLSKHADVAAVAVVPRADDVMGEIGVAVVVAADPARPISLAELREFAAPELAAYKLPGSDPRRRRASAHRGRKGRPASVGRRDRQAPNLTSSMELEFTADQEELRDSMRAVLSNESPVALARRVVEHDDPADELWATMVALGWPALAVPEADHGIGLGMIEVGILAEELGRVIAPGPLLPTVTQFVPVVREVGTAEQRHRFLGAVAEGECRGTLAIAERNGSYDPARVETTVVIDGDTAVLHGEKRFVMEGDRVDELVVVARDGDAIRAVVVAVARREAPTRAHAFDGSRRLVHVDLDGVRVPVDRVLGDRSASDATALLRAVQEATVGLALEMVGTAQTIFDVTLEYAKQREQFGVPIGSFQAIKHKFADMIDLAGARPCDRVLRRAHHRRGRRTPRDRDVSREGGGRRLPAPARQRRHPDPRRHRLHVGARHASLREAHQVRRAAVRHEQHPPRPHC